MDQSVISLEVPLDTNRIRPKKEESLNEEKDNEGASSVSGRSSPEANCPICLGKPENKSFTDSCLHQFCFTCLLQWSKVKAECPLCKQGFKSIIHTVRSIEDYEQYYLNTTSTESRLLGIITRFEPTQQREPFRYRTTAVSSYLDYFVRLEEAFSNHHLPSEPPPPRRRRYHGTSEFRRNIYQQGLWVQPTRIITGRCRESSPEFYRANPALVHRLAPWLNRELNVLCNNNEHLVQFVLGRILELVTQFHIRSPGFAAAVAPYIGRHTEHFVHEFHCFATSPFDLVGYDRHADYVGRHALAHVRTSEPSDDSGNDSDVQIVGPFPVTSPLHSIQLDSGGSTDSDECVVVDSVPARQQQPSPEVITLESDDEVVQVNINIDQPSTSSSRPSTSRETTTHRLPLKRSWLSLPSTSHDVNVSINIGPATTTASLTAHSDSSSVSSWCPRKKLPKTKNKKKRSKEKKSRKGKSLKKKKSSGRQRQASSSSDEGTRSESPVVVPHKRRPSVVLKSSSDEEESDVLHIVTDEELSTSSSSESDYKPRLRSVVVKSSVKTEPVDSSETYSRDFTTDSETVMPECSNSSWSDIRRNGFVRRARSYTSTSSEHQVTSSEHQAYKKRKHSKKRSRRDLF